MELQSIGDLAYRQLNFQFNGGILWSLKTWWVCVRFRWLGLFRGFWRGAPTRTRKRALEDCTTSPRKSTSIECLDYASWFKLFVHNATLCLSKNGAHFPVVGKGLASFPIEFILDHNMIDIKIHFFELWEYLIFDSYPAADVLESKTETKAYFPLSSRSLRGLFEEGRRHVRSWLVTLPTSYTTYLVPTIAFFFPSRQPTRRFLCKRKSWK
jgi:hypothetical protein